MEKRPVMKVVVHAVTNCLTTEQNAKLIKKESCMRERCSLPLLVCSCVLLAAMCCPAGTLETVFTAADVKDLPIGYRTPLIDPKGKQYAVRNNSDQTVEIQLTAIKPFKQDGQTRTHADIPDPSWLTIEPAALTLAPHQESKVEVHLAVPNDKQYANQKYEVWLLAETKGGQLGVGLITRITFNTVEKPATPSDEKAKPGDSTKPGKPSVDPANTNRQEK
jgi:hypothetical protein